MVSHFRNSDSSSLGTWSVSPSVCVSVIPFISVLQCSFVSLGRYIPRYFIIFVAIVNGTDSLISLSDFSLLDIEMQVISVY